MIDAAPTSRTLGRVLCEVEKGGSYVYVVPSVEDIPAAMTRAAALALPRKVSGRALTYRGADLCFVPLTHDPVETLRSWGGLVVLDPACEGTPDRTQLCRWCGARMVCVSRQARE
ncbi:MAG: hypothetical protein GY767_02785 [Shimia sp.]|nr:hypothetical protein [Shimia sp.]MCP4826230.1 hypothetical protein [Shimia sp.]